MESLNDVIKKFDNLPTGEKKEKIKAWNGEKLLAGYDFYSKHYDPLDDKMDESLALIREEIISRCDRR